MPNRISGLTIEINGDTTGLQTALKDANSELKSANTELRDINNLLKLDPSNVELLEQKQSALKDAISATNDKLETLKEASEQAYEALENGDITQAQFDALQREIISTEQYLASYESQLGDVEDALSGVDEESDDVATSTDDVSDSMEDAGNNTGFLDTALSNLSFTDVINMGSTAAKVLGDAAKAIFDMCVEAGNYADDVLTLATNTGMSAEKVQELQYASELCDTSFETIQSSMRKNISAMSKVRDGNEEARAAYERLGVEVLNEDGTLRNSQEVYWEVIDALGDIEDQTDRDALSQEIFGKSSQELNSLIATGSEGMKEYADEAHNMGYVLDNDALSKLGDMDDAFVRLDNATTSLKNNTAVLFADTITEIVDSLTGLIVGCVDKINPEKTILEGFISDIAKANDEVERSMNNTQALVSSVANTVSDLEAYKGMLLDVNGVEEKNEYQKYQVKSIVEKLADTIPELKDAYDEETGSVKLTNEELEALFRNNEALIMQEAYADMQTRAYRDLAEAQFNASKAQLAYDQALAEYNEVGEQYIYTFDQFGNQIQYLTDESAEAISNLTTVKHEMEEANGYVVEAQQIIDTTTEAISRLTASEQENTTATETMGDTAQSTGETMEQIATDTANAVSGSIDTMTSDAEQATEDLQDEGTTGGSDYASNISSEIAKGNVIVAASMAMQAASAVLSGLAMKATGTNTGEGYIGNMSDGIEGGKKTFTQKVNDVIGIANTFKDGTYSAGKNAGFALASSFASEMNAQRGTVYNAARSLASIVNSALQIHSPSKLLSWSGEMAGEGLVGGFENTIDASVNQVSQSALNFADAVATPVQNATTTNTSYNAGGINISVYGTSGMDVNDLADAVSERISDMYDGRKAVFA